MMDYSEYLKPFRKDTIYLRKAKKGVKQAGVSIPAWEDEIAMQVNLNPGSGVLIAAEYGLDLKDMCMAYTDPDIPAGEGDGVRVYGKEGEDPDYKIIGIKRWSGHWRLDLKRR